MTSEMAFECLLVSRDPGIFGILNRILRELSICTNICLSSSKASDFLAKGSTDLVVIDWEGEVSADLLHEIWTSTKRKKPTIVAISPTDRQIPGVHVVLKKPVTTESGVKSLKSAYSRMLMDHRRHSRYALMIPVKADHDNNRVVRVTIADIGDGGVGLVAKEELLIGDRLSFRVLLPGAMRDIQIQVRVLWTRDYGRAGCEFLHIPPVDLAILHDWLKSKIQIKQPLATL